MNPERSPNLPYYLGCPVWSCTHWTGIVYSPKSKKDQWLRDYTRCFNTVEGNSTFYGLPKPETAKRWASEAADGFRFAFKFPQSISHVPELRFDPNDLKQFLSFLEIFANRGCLGDTFLQLPPQLSARSFTTLQQLLKHLPTDWTWAVEPRHADWFDQAQNEKQFDGLLHEMGMSRVLFDSRPLYSRPPADEAEKVSQSRKPKSPFRETVTNARPMLRLVGRNRIEEVDAYLDEWATTIARWISQGLRPYVFTHTPDDQFAPAMAQKLHDKIRSLSPALPSLSALAQVGKTEKESGLKQLDLF
jgi:uncharacterized protein YecE (DUF72 family)